MASPKRPQTAYGYSMPSQASPSYPQYNLGVGLPGTVAPVAPQGSPNQLEALLRAIGLPATTPPMQPVPPQMPFGGGMGEPPMPLSGNPQDRLMPPGFVAQPVPMPPRLPEGRPIGGVPPYMPNPMESGYYTNPNQPPSGTAMPPQSQYGVPTSSDGKWLFNNGQWMPNSTAKTFPMPESRPEEVFPGPGQQTQPQQGTNMRSLFDALRAMQGRATAPQAPLVPERTMPIEYDDARPPKVDFNGPMTEEQRYKMLENFMGREPSLVEPVRLSPTESAMNRALRLARESEKARIEGGMPRMPSPTPVPQAEMGGRSSMGLGGILNALRASRKR